MKKLRYECDVAGRDRADAGEVLGVAGDDAASTGIVAGGIDARDRLVGLPLLAILILPLVTVVTRGAEVKADFIINLIVNLEVRASAVAHNARVAPVDLINIRWVI